MQFRVVHTTALRVRRRGGRVVQRGPDDPADHAPSQVVVHTRLDVAPTPWSHSYRDYWGTEVTAFEVLDQHSELTVTATSTVQVNRPAQQPAGLSWDEVRSPEVADRFCETLRGRRPGAPRRRARRRSADKLAAGGRRARATSPAQVCPLVYGRDEVPVRLDQGARPRVRRLGGPQGRLPGHGARRDRGAARVRGAGPLRVRLPAPQARAARSARPSWASRTRGSSGGTAGGVGFDPTNDIEPGDRHVVVARGRDYSDVPPLTGIFSGGSTSSMSVDVQVTRLS